MHIHLFTAAMIVSVTLMATSSLAHPGGHQADSGSRTALVSSISADEQPPAIAGAFEKFGEQVQTRWDKNYLYVESKGMPRHEMMVGITAWQQQVPLPHDYSGNNAWQIPLHPVPAKTPKSTKDHFFRGAIALAVNGVPIFNPIKNDGKTDTNLAGELDTFGGHCGRADDYHYHLPPIHLEETVGKGQPIAYALDGYPIFGYADQDHGPLDKFNGHKDLQGSYHYHATKAYPYLNGGFYGEVVERGGQVDPQPRAGGVRPARRPLRGAKITGFTQSEDQRQTTVEYDLRGEKRSVRTTINKDGSVTFLYDNGRDGKQVQTYQPRKHTNNRGGESRPGDERRKGDPKPDKPERRDRSLRTGEDQLSFTASAQSGSAYQTIAKARSADPAGRPPNIVFILVDDMGWRDVGFSGNTFVETPNIDTLASEGFCFTQAYASAPNCAPTRACFMSGQYTPRHGIYTVVDDRHAPRQPHHKIISATSKSTMSDDVFTIAEVLRERGYATACFGMWNLGRGKSGPGTPTNQGFDVFRRPQSLGFDRHAYNDPDGRYLTDVFTDEGIAFIEKNRDKPFFLYLPTHAVHAPFDPKPELVEKYRAKAELLGLKNADTVYAATIEAVDQNVGRIMAALTRLELDRNTLVVFTSDNGGTPKHVAPLKGSKGSLYEGGLRVPCAFWGYGITTPGGDSDEPILTMDFYPTLMEVASATAPDHQPIDGVSLLPVLTGADSIDRKAVYWHFPCYIGQGQPSSAVRSGDWKLIQFFEDQRLELYNLREDPRETKNLTKTHPDKTAQLRGLLANWQATMNAPIPTEPNPNYDPNAPRKKKRSKGK